MANQSGLRAVEDLRKLCLHDQSTVDGKDFGAGSRVSKSKCQRTVATIAKHGISSKKECIFLSALTEIFQPETTIELGTSVGIATAYLAKSNPFGRVFSFEGNEVLVQKSRDLLKQLNCENVQVIQGNINEMLPKELAQLEIVDFAVIDANHTYDALIRYFDFLKPRMRTTGAIVIDDIRWSTEMYRGWKRLTQNDEVTLSIEFLDKGLLLFEKSLRKQHYILSY